MHIEEVMCPMLGNHETKISVGFVLCLASDIRAFSFPPAGFGKTVVRSRTNHSLVPVTSKRSRRAAGGLVIPGRRFSIGSWIPAARHSHAFLPRLRKHAADQGQPNILGVSIQSRVVASSQLTGWNVPHLSLTRRRTHLPNIQSEVPSVKASSGQGGTAAAQRPSTPSDPHRLHRSSSQTGGGGGGGGWRAGRYNKVFWVASAGGGNVTWRSVLNPVRVTFFPAGFEFSAAGRDLVIVGSEPPSESKPESPSESPSESLSDRKSVV